MRTITKILAVTMTFAILSATRLSEVQAQNQGGQVAANILQAIASGLSPTQQQTSSGQLPQGFVQQLPPGGQTLQLPMPGMTSVTGTWKEPYSDGSRIVQTFYPNGTFTYAKIDPAGFQITKLQGRYRWQATAANTGYLDIYVNGTKLGPYSLRVTGNTANLQISNGTRYFWHR